MEHLCQTMSHGTGVCKNSKRLSAQELFVLMIDDTEKLLRVACSSEVVLIFMPHETKKLLDVERINGLCPWPIRLLKRTSNC